MAVRPIPPKEKFLSPGESEFAMLAQELGRSLWAVQARRSRLDRGKVKSWTT